jgi:antitoxin CcdA
MESLFDQEAPKKATNLSVNSDLLKKSKALNINLSATLEQALQAKLAKLATAEWVSENRKGIKSYNDFVEEHGCFGEEYKEF